MKHAKSETLKQIEPLLSRMRLMTEIEEKKPGIFYRGGKAFAHFHEDPQGIFADLRVSPNWQRFQVNTFAQQKIFIKAMAAALEK